MSGEAECVGFSECPCRRCRDRRTAATAAHPVHGPGAAEMCGACRTAATLANRVERAA